MAEEFDLTSVDRLLRMGWSISLGAIKTSIDMMRDPPQAVSRFVSGMKEIFTLPDATGPDFEDKAKALAGVWLEKGMSLLSEFKTAGEKLTEGK